MSLNVISQCARGDEIPLERVEFVVVHHTSLSREGPDNPRPIPDLDLDGAKLSRAFVLNAALGTGRRVPYHLLIRRDGVCEQLLPLTVRGAHAKGYNARSLAVAYVGEHGAPWAQQYRTLIQVCRALVVWTGGAKLVGHTDLPGASRDPRKQCPGLALHMPALVATIIDKLPEGWRQWDAHARASWLRTEGLVVNNNAAEAA